MTEAMKTILARFGRNGFYAGWIIALIYRDTADRLDWPLWATVLGIVAVILGASHAADRLAEHAASKTLERAT